MGYEFLREGLNKQNIVNRDISHFIYPTAAGHSSTTNRSPIVQFPPDSQLAAVTVATFAIRWANAFIPVEMDFMTQSGQLVSNIRGISSANSIIARYGRDEFGWQVVILECFYRDRMLLFLPPETHASASLTPEIVRRLLSSAVTTNIRLTMPAIRISANHNLNTSLQDSSLRDMVTPEGFSINLSYPPISGSNIEARQIIDSCYAPSRTCHA